METKLLLAVVDLVEIMLGGGKSDGRRGDLLGSSGIAVDSGGNGGGGGWMATIGGFCVSIAVEDPKLGSSCCFFLFLRVKRPTPATAATAKVTPQTMPIINPVLVLVLLSLLLESGGGSVI